MSSVVILLAPSKTMDTHSPCPWPIIPTEPLFIDQAVKIATKVRTLSTTKTMKLMGVSKPLAKTVQEYYRLWNVDAPGKPALRAYTGDVYKGLQASTMSREDADWAEQHLIIASGLYGLLRPYDGVQNYRLEMKAALPVGRRRNLYDFWRDSLMEYVQSRCADWLCNCCSDEYARPVLTGLKLPVVTPVFMDTKPNGTVGVVPIYSKIMRGVFARWLIDNRIAQPEQMKKFRGHGYTYDDVRSRPNFPVFSRSMMVPLRFT